MIPHCVVYPPSDLNNNRGVVAISDNRGCPLSWRGHTRFENGNRSVFFTVQHFMSHAKTYLSGQPQRALEQVRQNILADPSPNNARRLGRGVRLTPARLLEWDGGFSRRVAYRACMLKFLQDEVAFLALRSTQNRLLAFGVDDDHWGVGIRHDHPQIATESRWRRNVFGKVLMEVRQRLPLLVQGVTNMNHLPGCYQYPASILNENRGVVAFWNNPGCPFTQWGLYAFSVDGVRYMTAEHYMMAKKADVAGDAVSRQRIMLAPTPRRAKRIGRELRLNHEQWREWTDTREDVIYRGNYAKYTENAEIRTLLLSTGTRYLVEGSPLDEVYGVGILLSNPLVQDTKAWLPGQNKLGRVLMRVRDELRRLGDNPAAQ